MKGRLTLVLWVVLAIVVAATQGKGDSAGSVLATPASGKGLSRIVLVGATPAAAPDKSLQLSQITIEPGTKLPLHEHPGTQLASIVSGELHYFVVTGEVQVQRGAADGSPDSVETLAAGENTILKPGDAVIEREGVHHYAENQGSEPVVILTASLFAADQPASIPIATPAS
jgi:quercetin dioxygenase-like cupin family protein